MIEAFDEVAKDDAAVEDLKVWLLKQKQTQDWKTTKATADAIYALLLRGTDLLASDELVKVSLGGNPIVPEKVEARCHLGATVGRQLLGWCRIHNVVIREWTGLFGPSIR